MIDILNREIIFTSNFDISYLYLILSMNTF